MSAQSIITKGIGCNSCHPFYPSLPPSMKWKSQISAVGFEGIPSYEDFKTKDIWL